MYIILMIQGGNINEFVAQGGMANLHILYTVLILQNFLKQVIDGLEGLKYSMVKPEVWLKCLDDSMIWLFPWHAMACTMAENPRPAPFPRSKNVCVFPSSFLLRNASGCPQHLYFQ